MTRYRKRPVEVKAWQVGSEEPKPEWLEDFDVSQMRDDWIVRKLSPNGCINILSNEEFEQTYEVVEDD